MKKIGTLVRPRLTRDERAALEEIRVGSDIVSPALARTLRDIQAKHPQLVQIGRITGLYGVQDVRPYFHAKLSEAGGVALAPAPRAKGGAK